MKISKTKFLNYIRCNRYVALEEIANEKDDAIVSFSNDIELEDLMSIENQTKKIDIQNNLSSEFIDQDEIDNKQAQLEMLQPYYNQLELLSGKAISNRFDGNIIYNLDTYKQKSFSYLKSGFEFFCFLDGYQEDEDTIRIFETKATTSNKFSVDNYNYRKPKDKTKYPMFTKMSNGIFVPSEDVLNQLPKSYYNKEAKMFNYLDNIGNYIYDLAFQRYVFEQSQNTTKKVEYYLVILNHEYVHDGNVDNEGNAIYSDDIIKFYNLTSVTKKLVSVIEQDANKVIDRLNQMDARIVDVGAHCMRNKTKECPFYNVCFKDVPKENSIFVYDQRHHGFVDDKGVKHGQYDLVNEGRVFALDIPKEWLSRNNNVIQRNVIESGQAYYNKQKIIDGLNEIKYPIYHLDFESFNAPIPRFNKESPYTQSLFQFSIHIEHEPGVCHKDFDHYHFLASDFNDNREALTKKLISIIKPDGGTVMTYNASFEKTRIKELQTYFPQYYNELENINNRIFDLMDIVKTNTKFYKSLGYSTEEAKAFNFYHPLLNGSYSIKKVLPIFTDLSYSNMNVSDGMAAMVAYSKFPYLKDEELQQLRNDLIKYCKQDTWAMVEILRALRKI